MEMLPQVQKRSFPEEWLTPSLAHSLEMTIECSCSAAAAAAAAAPQETNAANEASHVGWRNGGWLREDRRSSHADCCRLLNAHDVFISGITTASSPSLPWQFHFEVR